MNEAAFTRLVLTLLLLVCAALLYLDWMRNAAIEAVNVRVDALVPPVDLGVRQAVPVRETPSPPAEPWAGTQPLVDNDPLPGAEGAAAVAPPQAMQQPHPLILAALQAHTDRELSGLAE